VLFYCMENGYIKSIRWPKVLRSIVVAVVAVVVVGAVDCG